MPDSRAKVADPAVLDELGRAGRAGVHEYRSFSGRGGVADRWSAEQTERFYTALSKCGTDFEMMSIVLWELGKTRAQIKNKFVKEDKENPERVERALVNRLPLEVTEFGRQAQEEAHPEPAVQPADSDFESEDSESESKSKSKSKRVKR